MNPRITWLGHSTVVIDIGDVRVITDPLLGRHAGLLRRRGPFPDPASWSGVDVVLLSHLHHDHTELRSLRMLPNVPILTAPVNAAWLVKKGFTAAVGLAPHDWYPIGKAGEVQVRLAPAVHAGRPMPHRPNAANGHLVRHVDGVVWAVGDTESFPELGRLSELAGGAIDVALVPVGGWAPRLSPGHLDPAAAARVCDMVGASFAIPVHWGSFSPPGVRHLKRGWMDQPGSEFPDAVRRYAPGCEPVVLAPGESWSAPAKAAE